MVSRRPRRWRWRWWRRRWWWCGRCWRRPFWPCFGAAATPTKRVVQAPIQPTLHLSGECGIKIGRARRVRRAVCLPSRSGSPVMCVARPVHPAALALEVAQAVGEEPHPICEHPTVDRRPSRKAAEEAGRHRTADIWVAHPCTKAADVLAGVEGWGAAIELVGDRLAADVAHALCKLAAEAKGPHGDVGAALFTRETQTCEAHDVIQLAWRT